MDEGLLYVVWKKDKQIEDSRLRENEQGLRIGGGGFHVTSRPSHTLLQLLACLTRLCLMKPTNCKYQQL